MQNVQSVVHIDENQSAEEKYQIFRKIIIDFVDNRKKYTKPTLILNKYVYINKKKYKIREIIEFYTKFLDPYNSTDSERVYCFYHDIRKIIFCHNCYNVKVNFINFSKGYYKYCSHKCAVNDLDVKEKTEQTNYKKYGVKNPMQSDVIKDKFKQNIERLNIEDPLRVDKIKEKRSKTNLTKYGVKSTFQVEEFKKKAEQTRLERYGVKHALQFKEIQEKIKQTNLKNYDVEYIMQSEEMRRKAKKTTFKNYGVEHPIQSERIQQKTLKTKFQNFFNNILLNKDFIDEYELLFSLDEYKGVKGRYYKFRHRKCGHVFQCRIEDGRVPECPKCFPSNISNGEREVAKFVSQYSKNIILNSKAVILPKELDIYLSDYNLAIEYNGIYWHSTEFHKNQYHHINKTMDCMRKEIKLIQIFENEWATTQDAVKSLILENLNELPYYINSKECILKEVDKQEALDFLEVHSVYEPEDYDLRLGLYYQDQLASYIGLTKISNDSYIINIYCNYNFTNINSLPIFLDYLKDKKLVYYANLRFERGKLFKDNQFEKLEYIPPQSICINENTIFDCGYIPYQYN